MAPQDGLLEALLASPLTLPGGRKLVAIAGPPGAGKSTLAKALRARLADRGRRAAIVPMDGFHLDNTLLRARGLLGRKGAPASFDAAGLAHLVGRIAAGETGVVFPAFDRGRDLAIAGAGVVPDDTEFVLFEGNYLLLRDAPWSDLARHWTFTVRLDVPMRTLEDRLLQRWLDQGLDIESARARRDGNDLPNVRLVSTRSADADMTLSEPV